MKTKVKIAVPPGKPPHRSLVLYDMILPMLFFEVFYVFLAFIPIVIIETAIISFVLKEKFTKLVLVVALANFITTIVGYVVQGFARFSLLAIPGYYSPDNPILQGISGNVGANYYEYKKGLPLEVMVEFITSFVICFFLSVYVENIIVRKFIQDPQKKKKVYSAVFLANLASYALLFVWLIWNYLSFQK